MEFFIAAAVIVGILIAVNDFRHGVIPNKWILLLLCLALVFRFFSPPDIQSFLLAAGFSAFTALLFWEIGIWPGGDTKLYIALSLFFPASFYLSQGLVMGFLTNVFVPIAVFMAGAAFFRSNFGAVKKAMLFSVNPYRILMLSVMLLGFVWLMSLPFKFLGIQPNYFISLIFLFIAFELLMRFFTEKTEFLFLGLAALRIVIDFNSIFSLSFLFNFLTLLAVFVSFRFFVPYMALNAFTESVPVRELKEGMVPAEGIKKSGKKFSKEQLLDSSFIGFMRRKRTKYIHGIGSLDREAVKKIQALSKKGLLGFDSLKIHKTQPFACFIVLGYVITILAAGENFIALLIGA